VASLYYINKHHDLQTLSPTDTVRQEKKTEGEQDPIEKEGTYDLLPEARRLINTTLVDPYPADAFKAGQKELAQDLIIKEQQIEALISMLPGLDNSEKDQEDAIQQLEEELMAAEKKRKEAVKEKDAVLARLESVIRSVKRP
jgi:mediator of RNA polymerase II transcription subunit 21